MTVTTKSIESFARSLTADVAFGDPLELRFGQCRIRVRTNNRKLSDRLHHYFRAFVDVTGVPDYEMAAIQMTPPELGLRFEDWPRDAGKVGRKDLICDIAGGRVVHKARTGMQFLVAPGTRIAFGDCLANDNQVINFIISQYMSWLRNRGWEICHAAGIVLGGAGLAISASSGGGKSTLALHLISRGARFVSNDRLLIADGGAPRMAGVPKMPRVNPGTLLNNPDLTDVLPDDRRRALAAMSRDELWGLEEKYDVDVEALFGADRMVLEAPLSTFIVLRWSRSATAPFSLARVDLENRQDLLDAIMKPPGPFHLATQGNAPRTISDLDRKDYLSRLRGVTILEATGRVAFDRACDAIMSGGY
jgi:HprK-related kinase B